MCFPQFFLVVPQSLSSVVARPPSSVLVGRPRHGPGLGRERGRVGTLGPDVTSCRTAPFGRSWERRLQRSHLGALGPDVASYRTPPFGRSWERRLQRSHQVPRTYLPVRVRSACEW